MGISELISFKYSAKTYRNQHLIGGFLIKARKTSHKRREKSFGRAEEKMRRRKMLGKTLLVFFEASNHKDAEKIESWRRRKFKFVNKLVKWIRDVIKEIKRWNNPR